MVKYIYGLALLLFACDNVPSPPHSPEKELSTFEIAPGFKIELVASEPLVQDPVVIQFDENGRLWVVEMRGFMPDIEGTGEDAPVGRISILTDQDMDGRMDNATIFIDSLVLPRALAIVEGGALVAEDQVLWFIEDTNNDLKADKSTVVDAEYGKKGVVEHSPNALWRGMDNWYYNAKSSNRYRWDGDKWIKQATEFRGQWGMSHDNYGRLYYNYNWSQLHMDLVPPNYLNGNSNHEPTSGIDYVLSTDRQIFPIRTNPAINRGYIPGTLDEHGSLIEFTSACAPYVYRGHLFDTSLVGDVFVCEPTGNLIKHNKVTGQGISPIAENAYHQKEFLASTDERFRPVWISSGPDGALYIADMYRGIIQHGLYMSDYLKEVTLKRKLDQHINLGRIWRVVPTSAETIPPPKALSNMSSKELVELLEHTNGWYRDMAQRLLVERNQPAVLEVLRVTATNNPNPLARLHALWVLEGLNYIDPDFYLNVLEKDSGQVQITALRILEQLVPGNPKSLTQLEKRIPHADNEGLALQLVLSSRVLTIPVKHKLILDVLTGYQDSQIFRDAAISSIHNEEYRFLSLILGQATWQAHSDGKEIMIELLATAIANKKDPEELTAMLNIVDTENLSWQNQAMISGLSFHSTADSDQVYLREIPDLFKKQFVDKNMQSKVTRLSTLYSWPGKEKTIKDPAETVSLATSEFRAQGRNVYLSTCASCHGNDGKGLSRFAPPLINSEWVLGDPERLIKILLHGMEGPIEVNGKVYDSPDILPVMPAFASSPEHDLAAVMTYIRQEWGHQQSTIEPGTVGRLRIRTQGKVKPWRAEELLEVQQASNTE